MFKPTGKYVRLLGETLKDVGSFLILFLCILFTFANALFILNKQRYEDEQLYQEYFDSTILDSIFQQYLLSLGEVYSDNYKMNREDWYIWALLIIMTAITQIVFLNMLVAIMGDTFSKVMERQKEYALKEKIGIIADYAVIIPRGIIAPGNVLKHKPYCSLMCSSRKSRE